MKDTDVYLFHHVFLPPKLPSASDVNSRDGQAALVNHLAVCVPDFAELTDQQARHVWRSIERTLKVFSELHARDGHLSSEKLQDHVRALEVGETIILHIALQNSSLILRREEEHFLVESFEVAAPAEQVLSATDALQWEFPSQAVRVAISTFLQSEFLTSLCGFLEKASAESVKEFAATTKKAGVNVYESRDVASPFLVGQLLIAILESNGTKDTIEPTRKRIRDEVYWDTGAEDPWRRSSAWLTLRVGIQRCLCSVLGVTVGTLQFKAFSCFQLALLCERLSTSQNLPLDLVAFARARLGRRAAKLQYRVKLAGASLSIKDASLAAACSATVMKVLEKVGSRLDEQEALVRKRSLRKITKLPRRADEESTILKLHHSFDYLSAIVIDATASKPGQRPVLKQRNQKFDKQTTWTDQSFAKAETVADYLDLKDIEDKLLVLVSENGQNASEDRCEVLLDEMRQYYRIARDAYASNPERISRMILLLVELWLVMDASVHKCAPHMRSLMSQYDPGFPEDFLHVLQLATLEDMIRLNDIEQRLKARTLHANQELPSVFSEISSKSFHVQYFDQTASLKAHHARMLAANEGRKALKQAQWRQMDKVFDKNAKEMAGLACQYKQDENHPMSRTHDDKACRKCFLGRVNRRTKIDIHEDSLPDDEVQAKALVFELHIPKVFAAWRDATWLILQLGKVSQKRKPKTLVPLCDINNINTFAKARDPFQTIMLASSTKSFGNTHYKTKRFPVTIEKICVPHGSRYHLYDGTDMTWTSETLRNSKDVAKLCQPHFPPASTYLALREHVHPTFCDQNITPNMIIASQTACPSSLPVSEYLAFKNLRTGGSIQWPTLARELASSSLNFGAVEVCTLVTQLALMAGPPSDVSKGRMILRANHWVFTDSQFCGLLLAQIQRRLEVIAENWRESQTMQCLFKLLERLWYLSVDRGCCFQAERLIITVRTTTHAWVRHLMSEFCSAKDVDVAQKRSKDALFAALICRQTFILELERPRSYFEPEHLSIYLECGFTVKDNLPIKESGLVSKLAIPLRNLYVRDLHLNHSLTTCLQASISETPSAVTSAVQSLLGDPGNGDWSQSFTRWSFLAAPDSLWVSAQSVAANGVGGQTVHFNIWDFTLLIDGQPLGRLPDEYSKQSFFQQFFGDRVFQTYPSRLRGMSYMLARPFEGHYIHFGFRNGMPIMRAMSAGRFSTLMEFIPPETFFNPGHSTMPDLPSPLIDKHVHWLDIAAGFLVIRPFDSMWRHKESDWNINLRTRKALRRQSLLVDPTSAVFAKVASLIEPFEKHRGMRMYQPPVGGLALDLPNLELSFRVNGQGLLESKQLRAIIDVNQDAGTLYGLADSIVLRDSIIPENRSILVAMGEAKMEKQPGIPRVTVTHNGYYARFFINELLGRLECACEPRLIYWKAYMHALTSSAFPDPLTGRTGTQEALRCLAAGDAQPWAPLDLESYRMLSWIAALTPDRVYYPPDMRVLQKVSWHNIMISAAQHEAFRPSVTRIMDQCRALWHFAQHGDEPPAADEVGCLHLSERAMERQCKFQAAANKPRPHSVADITYTARDQVNSTLYKRAFEAACLAQVWSKSTSIHHDLAQALAEAPRIDGYQSSIQTHLLSDILNVDVAAQWGSLVRACRELRTQPGKQALKFLFATLAFGPHSDILLIRTLIAISHSDQCNNIELPAAGSFEKFSIGEEPTEAQLLDSAESFVTPFSPYSPVHATAKRRKNILMMQEVEREQYEKIAGASCKEFALHLKSQWPTRCPSLEGARNMKHLETDRALASIEGEWARLHDNLKFQESLQNFQALVSKSRKIGTAKSFVAASNARTASPAAVLAFKLPSLFDLLSDHPDYLSQPDCQRILDGCVGSEVDLTSQSLSKMVNLDKSDGCLAAERNSGGTESAAMTRLKQIVHAFVTKENVTRLKYGNDLARSIEALEGRSDSATTGPSLDDQKLDVETVKAQIELFESGVAAYLESLRSTITTPDRALYLAALLPSINPSSLLVSLRSPKRGGCASPPDAIVVYGNLICRLQHLRRIQNAARLNDKIRLADETRAPNEPWSVAPGNNEWRLLEIDFDLRIRPDQYEVAKSMINPSNGINSVLQMNMGQGKSSVIIPMIIAYLANSRNLVRVVVPKPLLLQAAQLIQGRFGGLIGGKVKHVPFSRRNSTDPAHIELYYKMHFEAMQSGDILLALPEHLLSFQLSGLQELSNGNVKRAKNMIRVQSWLQKNTRDVLDECDIMLAVKTQLIYPSGSQKMVDGHPFRWTIVQSLLKLTRKVLFRLVNDYPQSVELIQRSPGSFPTVYLLSDDCKETLLQRLRSCITDGSANILPIENCSLEEEELVKNFLCCARISTDGAPKASSLFEYNIDARNKLLLLRGLLLHQILLLSLSKRWNVQYGVHAGRDPVAVPFTSKGIPSEQAEFGHPDVSITLTCLSFYYTGLSLPQFLQCFVHVLRADEPNREFEVWQQDIPDFPTALSDVTSINVDDETQISRLWQLLHLQMPVVNYFLNTFVFPRHARTFDRKLTSSAWDLAAPDLTDDGLLAKGEPKAKEKAMTRPSPDMGSLTVGFSGTNDNKDLLPMHIKQNDLPGLSHTNAEVLTYLLMERNSQYLRASDENGKRLSEIGLLQKLFRNETRMLLDAGAYILEHDNLSLAEEWLKIDYGAEGAVFFGQDGRARVLFRDGKKQPLATSRFLDNLGACVVYLDEAHTR